MPVKTHKALPGLASETVRAVETSSVVAKPAAIEVFLIIAISTLMIGGITVRIAWGRTIRPRDWPPVKPTARAASACPTPTELIPERTASHTNAEVYTDSATMAWVRPIGIRMSIVSSTAATKMKISVSGVLRISSTHAVETQRSVESGETRIAARATPTTREMAPATTDRYSVVRKPFQKAGKLSSTTSNVCAPDQIESRRPGNHGLLPDRLNLDGYPQ